MLYWQENYWKGTGYFVMKLYIDPGTGSMLFAILIGIIGALGYLAKELFVKLRFLLSGGKKVEENSNKLPYVRCV